MEKWVGKNGIFLRMGFGGIFFLTNSIVLFWADLAGKVMGDLETGKEIRGAILQLAYFLVLSVCIYLFLIFVNRRLLAVFEKGIVAIQERYIQQDLMKSSKSKKYSELELINRACDDLRTVVTWSYQTKSEFILSIIDLISVSISSICEESSLISFIVCFNSRDLAGITEPIEFLAAFLYNNSFFFSKSAFRSFI